MKMKNTRGGSYNGIAPGETIDVEKKEVEAYKEVGFVEYDENAEKEAINTMVSADEITAVHEKAKEKLVEAEKVLEDAKKQAAKIVADAEEAAKKTAADATTSAEKVLEDAKKSSAGAKDNTQK